MNSTSSYCCYNKCTAFEAWIEAEISYIKSSLEGAVVQGEKSTIAPLLRVRACL